MNITVIPQVFLLLICISGFCQTPSLDLNFGQNGRIIKDLYKGGNFCYDLEIQSDGKIICGGYTNDSLGTNQFDFLLLRLMPNGMIDSTFGSNGWKTVNISGAGDQAIATEILNDGKILLAGPSFGTSTNMAVVRLTSNGELDSTFADNGIWNKDLGSSEILWDMQVRPNGKVLLIGDVTSTETSRDAGIISILSDGRIDSTFGENGLFQFDIDSLWNTGKLGIITSIGDLVFSGSGNSIHYLVRVDSLGIRDSSFGDDGVVSLGFTNASRVQVEDILELENQSLLVACWVTENGIDELYLKKILSNGSVDSTFGIDGIWKGEPSYKGPHGLVRLSNGTIIVGVIQRDNGESRHLLLGLDKDGNTVSSFNQGNPFVIDFMPSNENITRIRKYQDSKIILGGFVSNGDLNFDITVISVDLDASVSIEDKNLSDYFLGFGPNPVKLGSPIKLYFPDEKMTFDSPIKIEIFDINGRKVFDTLYDRVEKNNLTIPTHLNVFKEGVFYLKVSRENSVDFQFKILIN